MSYFVDEWFMTVYEKYCILQMFKGSFYYCKGPSVLHIVNKTECIADHRNVWVNRKYNFDNLGLVSFCRIHVDYHKLVKIEFNNHDLKVIRFFGMIL